MGDTVSLGSEVPILQNFQRSGACPQDTSRAPRGGITLLLPGFSRRACGGAVPSAERLPPKATPLADALVSDPVFYTFSDKSKQNHRGRRLDCCCPWPCPLSRPLLTRASTEDPQTLTGRSGSVSRGGHCTFPWVLVPTGFVCALPESLVGMRFDFNVSAPLLLSCFGFSFVLGRGASFFGGFAHPPVDGCSAASCAFGVLAGDGECTPFYSTILHVWG